MEGEKGEKSRATQVAQKSEDAETRYLIGLDPRVKIDETTDNISAL